MKSTTRNSYQERILQVLLHIQAHLDEPLAIEELAGLACFSPYHFHRVFTGMVGESLAAYVRRLRLERSAHALRFGRRSVTDLALEAGYDTLESFSRAFHRMFGSSPSRFRAEHTILPTSADNCLHLPRLPERGACTMDMTIKTFDPIRVAFVRHTGPYAQCGKAWSALCGWAGPKGLLNASTQFLGLSYDDPDTTAPEHIRYDACITVGPEVEPGQGVAIMDIPGGDYAVTIHAGPLENLNATYVELCGQALPGTQREIAAQPSVEQYLNDPDTTKPEDLRVEVRVPLLP